MKPFPRRPARLLIRSTNWIGDAIMTTPAIRDIRRNFPDSEITLLALPWVADVFAGSSRVDRIIRYERPGRHAGLAGKWRLAGELRRQGFDAAILLQNALEAALITWLARIPARGGYSTDGRGPLLSHGVRRAADVKTRHQVFYYQEMLQGLGLAIGPDSLELELTGESRCWAEQFLGERGAREVIGLNPGAAYGPAKRWPAERYGRLAGLLGAERPEAVFLVFGTRADSRAAAAIARESGIAGRVVDLTGTTTLAQAMALIQRCRLFVTNDSGLMHVAAALAAPTLAVFGSTDHVATGPHAECAAIVRHPLACSPCLRTDCPEGHFRCMLELEVEEVLAAARRMVQG